MPVDVRKPLKKLLPHLLQAKEDNLNEADTLQRIIKLFEDVLGYDPFEDISREAQMKGKYVDVALKVDGIVRLLVEAKAAGVKLRDRHIEQAQSYASRNNYRWVLLTNGVVWTLYHLTFEDGIEYERAFTVDISKDDISEASKALSLLHKTSIQKGELDDYWEQQVALGPESIGGALFHEAVLLRLRRELRKDVGRLMDIEDLARAVHDLLSQEARERIGPVRIRKKTKSKRQQKVKSQPEGPAPDASDGVDKAPDGAGRSQDLH